jgi:hypothetical protein
MTKIYIEDNLLDINAQLSNQITYAIDDIRNIDSKATPFTKTIVLPGTAKNNNLLGNIFEFNNSNDTNNTGANVGYNFNAARTAKCRIDIDGMTLIKGTFRLLEIIIDGSNIEYECSVLGELGGFVTKLGASKLEDLDFSQYDHAYSITNITTSWNNVGGSSYVYPLIDYGTYGLTSANVAGGKHNWKLDTFRPAFYAKEYIDKIFASAGYTYECSLFNTTRFKNLIIPHSQKILQNNTTLLFNAQGNDNVDVGAYTYRFRMFSTVSGSFTAFSDNKEFKYIGTTTSIFNINVTINYPTETRFDWILQVKIQIGGTGLFYPTSFTIPAGNIGTFNYTTNSSFTPNTRFRVDLYDSSGGNLVDWDYKVQVITTTPTLIPLTEGQTILVNSVIPQNILQKDFFTSIIKLFNLYVDEDRFNDKHLIIKPYVDYYLNNIEDWTLKIDRSKAIKVKPMSELNSRYYQFNFKEDSDYYNDLYKKRYNQSYGSYLYDSQFQFAKETAKNEIIFSPTVLVGYTSEDKVYSTIFKRSGTDTAPVEDTTDSNIRLLQFKKITGVASWLIRNTANSSTLNTGTVYPYAGHLDSPDAPANDINFGVPKQLFFTLVSGNLTVNQFNVYYSPYMAEITDKDSKLLTCEVKLNDVDVFNLDFSKYYYIDGGLYRLTKLIDYTPNSHETTKAEFLKLINKVY